MSEGDSRMSDSNFPNNQQNQDETPIRDYINSSLTGKPQTEYLQESSNFRKSPERNHKTMNDHSNYNSRVSLIFINYYFWLV